MQRPHKRGTGSISDQVKMRLPRELQALVRTLDEMQHTIEQLRAAAAEAGEGKGRTADLSAAQALDRLHRTQVRQVGVIEALQSMGIHSGFAHRSGNGGEGGGS